MNGVRGGVMWSELRPVPSARVRDDRAGIVAEEEADVRCHVGKLGDGTDPRGKTREDRERGREREVVAAPSRRSAQSLRPQLDEGVGEGVGRGPVCATAATGAAGAARRVRRKGAAGGGGADGGADGVASGCVGSGVGKERRVVPLSGRGGR